MMRQKRSACRDVQPAEYQHGPEGRIKKANRTRFERESIDQEVQPGALTWRDDLPGQALLDVVFARLNLIETAYFGIRYIDQDNQTHWLDPAARLSRQLKAGKVAYDLYFGVKFYACDPCKLVEEITRYQLFLQVKQDILQGRLPVSFELAAELGAYVVQAELGNYDPRKHPPGYVSEFRLLNNQTKEIESRIHELHIQLEGMTPSQAEFNYLDKVKWHDMYGVDLHPVLGEDSVEYFLGLTPGGIVVLRNKTTVAHYYWPRIAKVYYKGRYFMLRVCDKNNEVSTYGFETPKKSACKHLWKCCVEHHSFFRLVRVAPMQATGTLGSKYSGRSERQSMKDVAAQQRIQPTFTRTPSRRQPRRVMHDAQQEAEKLFDAPKYIQQEIKSVSIPQPAQSIPAALNGSTNGGAKTPAPINPPDSPRSTRSAPWMRSQQRGLFGINSSPKSVRSASTRMSAPANNARMRSSSVESHSSNESRSGRRRRHRSRRVSDNESEMSRGSGRSGRSHNSHRKHRRHRSKNRRNRSDTESRDRSYSGHRRSTDSIELVDSGEQWLEVQRKQHSDAVPKAAVIKSSQVMKGTHPDSGIVAHHQHRSRRHRKHRSPSEKIWSSELTKHLQFDLVDTTGMTEDQLREIPMMSSMSMGDFISPTGSSLSPLDSSGLRVSHEHTDSGLGADQDYAYSSERSSDSAKYGTNKSSGASVTSGHTKSRHHQQLGGRPYYPGAGGSIGSGLSTSTYLDTVATLSSSATPYHYFYDGTGFRTNAALPSGSGLHPMGSGSGVRGTKSDIGVPIRPKRHYQQQTAQQHPTSVHSFKRQAADRRQPSPSSLTKSIDYLENYKTGVERLNQGNSFNNNNPDTFAGLLGAGAGCTSGSQNGLNNNSHPVHAKGQGEGRGAGADDVVGPLICFDSNRNQHVNREEPTVATPTRDGGRASAASNARPAGDNGNVPTDGGGFAASPTERRPGGQSARESPAKGATVAGKRPQTGSSPARFGVGKNSNHRSSSLELILTPIIQSRRAQ
uniref:Erythrocyte membrane protein band 4.1-like 4A n=1 Tax=Anopheles atroparvus TaxID=41427 RepID=A0A182JC47_ANOAO